MVMETESSLLPVASMHLSTPPLQNTRSLASILISGNRTHRKKYRNVTFSFDLEYEKSKNPKSYDAFRPSLKRKLTATSDAQNKHLQENQQVACTSCKRQLKEGDIENSIKSINCSCSTESTSNGETTCTHSSSPKSSRSRVGNISFSSTPPSVSRSIFSKQKHELPFDFNRVKQNKDRTHIDSRNLKQQNMTKLQSKCMKPSIPSLLNSPHSRSGSMLESLKESHRITSPNVTNLSPSLLLGRIMTEINSTETADTECNPYSVMPGATLETDLAIDVDQSEITDNNNLTNDNFITNDAPSSESESLNNLTLNQSKSIQTSLSKYFNMTCQDSKSSSISNVSYKDDTLSLPSELHTIYKKNSKLNSSPLTGKKSHAKGQTYIKTRMQKSKQNSILSLSPTSNSKEQMCIDAGQRDIGHVICPGCGMVYTKSQVDDEAYHAKFHHKLINKLRFGGWKSEKVLDVYNDGRVIVISNQDHHLHLKKVNEVRDVVDTELGFASPKNRNSEEMTFLFISNRKVIGCVIVVPIKKAFPVILSDSNQQQQQSSEAKSPVLSWCCSTDPVPALCGINRMWVFNQARRQNIATRLVDCVRNHFMYGCVIGKDNIAFSDPTPSGRAFAEKYCETKKILVFR